MEYPLILVALKSDDFTFFGTATLNINEQDDVTCSFAGGCQYSIVAQGLTSSLANTPQSSIEVCGNTCLFSADQSDSGQATCVLEPLVTKYSADAYKLVESDWLHGTWTDPGT